MTKKNLKPQQAAPVQREINTTSSECDTGLTPSFIIGFQRSKVPPYPFAGDDAE